MTTNEDLHVLAVCKGTERYIVLYGDSQRVEAARTLVAWAERPDLSLTKRDADDAVCQLLQAAGRERRKGMKEDRRR